MKICCWLFLEACGTYCSLLRPPRIVGPLVGHDAELSIRHPRFSPNGTSLVYLQCEAGGPHCRCMSLELMSWPDKHVKSLVPIVNTPKTSTFCGIYSPYLTQRCFTDDGSHVLFSTPVRSNKVCVSIRVKFVCLHFFGTVQHTVHLMWECHKRPHVWNALQVLFNPMNFGTYALYALPTRRFFSPRNAPLAKLRLVSVV